MTPRTARVLCISPVETTCANAGNRVRILNMMRALTDWGHTVEMFTFPSPMETPTVRRGTALDSWYTHTLERDIVAVVRTFRPHVVIVQYAYFARLLDLVGSTSVLKVIDTHDVFTKRNQRLRALGVDYDGLLPSFETAADEARELNRADVVIGIHEGESAFFRSICDRPVVTIGHVVEPTPAAACRRETHRMIYVGSRSLVGGHNLRHFADSIFPSVRRAQPSATLLVVGGVGDALKQRPRGCHRVSFVDTLDRCYRMVDVAVNADQFATGLSIKSVTALSYGCPLVTTTTGARGLPPGAGAFLCADGDREFVEISAEVLANRTLRRTLSVNALQFTAALLEQNLASLRALFR